MPGDESDIGHHRMDGLPSPSGTGMVFNEDNRELAHAQMLRLDEDGHETLGEEAEDAGLIRIRADGDALRDIIQYGKPPCPQEDSHERPPP